MTDILAHPTDEHRVLAGGLGNGCRIGPDLESVEQFDPWSVGQQATNSLGRYFATGFAMHSL